MSRLVPWPGGRLARTGNEGPRSTDGLSIGRLRLCVRAAAGGGPGGGGGIFMPGSHTAGDLLAERDGSRARVMSPVDAALRAAGAREVGLPRLRSGPCAKAWAVFTCRASIALTGEVALFLFLEVRDDKSLPA